MAQRSRIGVRELRQNLSVHLRRVKAGETLEVTERGVPVAELVPLGEPADARTRLAAAGRLLPARGGLRALGAPRGRPGAVDLGRALDEVREDRG